MLPPKHCNINLTGPIPRWDEAIPLGNGILGSLFWGPMEHLRISVDIAGLWLRRRPEEKLDKECGIVPCFRNAQSHCRICKA